MKRSRSIRLVLIGGLSAGALTSCGPKNETQAPIQADAVYTNNYYVPGVGYYHAPFRGWYALPYNHFDSNRQLYFFGGQWNSSPHQSITNISNPTLTAASLAESQRTDIARGGFGSSSRSYWSGGHSWGGIHA